MRAEAERSDWAREEQAVPLLGRYRWLHISAAASENSMKSVSALRK